MDEETKKYVDRKFAEAQQREEDRELKALAFIKERQATLRKAIFAASVVLCILLLILMCILFWAQFR